MLLYQHHKTSVFSKLVFLPRCNCSTIEHFCKHELFVKLEYLVPVKINKQAIDFFLAFICFLTGLVLYVLFRPTTLLMFQWADSFGLMEIIRMARSHVHGLNRYLADWIIFSLPYALWVLSYRFCISGIWGKSTSSDRVGWFWGVPITAIASELAQGLGFIPGHFDSLDLISIIFATIIGYFVTSLS